MTAKTANTVFRALSVLEKEIRGAEHSPPYLRWLRAHACRFLSAITWRMEEDRIMEASGIMPEVFREDRLNMASLVAYAGSIIDLADAKLEESLVTTPPELPAALLPDAPPLEAA